MRRIALIMLVFAAFCTGCADRRSSAAMQAFSPSSIVLRIAKAHKLDMSETGKGQSVDSGHEERVWHYYSESKVDDIKTVVSEIQDAFGQELGRLGADVNGRSEEPHAFVVYSLNYSQGLRKGTLRIIAATLEKGTAVDVFIDEHPQ